MTQLQSVPGQQLLPIVAPPAAPKTVKELLKEFAKQPGCETYKNDGERIALLTTFIWLRQLTPNLPFETFLQLYAPLADYNEENRKHPEDVIKFHCPRRAKGLAPGEHQWTADEVVDFVTLYIDVIRTAEAAQTPPPLTFDQFLGALKSQFLNGDFKEPEPPPGEKPKRKSAAASPEAVVVVRPTAGGQRVLYTLAHEGNRQVRGVVEGITADGDRQYVTLRADSGEVFSDVSILHCQVISDNLPPGQVDGSGQQLEELERQSLTVPKSVFPQIKNALALTSPMGNVAIGDAIQGYEVAFANNYSALIDIINGETGPFVDARLVRSDRILDELPPRKNLEGIYDFRIEQGLLRLEVKVRA